jgi:hypothetical protein
MPRLKVLFADDHIPDDKIPTSSIEELVHVQRPDLNDADVRACRPMRNSVEKLKDADGFDVTIANRYADALRLAQGDRFDIAIIDLGWFLDDALPDGDRASAGWKIAEAVQAAVADGRAAPTAQILYSNRLAEDRSIADRAARQNMLPVYKSFDESGTNALRAAVKYLEAFMNQPAFARARRLEELRGQMASIDETALKRLAMWTWLTMAGVGLSLALVLVGVGLALSGNTPVGVVTAATSALAGVVSRLLLGQLKEARQDVKTSRAKLQEEAKSLERASAA